SFAAGERQGRQGAGGGPKVASSSHSRPPFAWSILAAGSTRSQRLTPGHLAQGAQRPGRPTAGRCFSQPTGPVPGGRWFAVLRFCGSPVERPSFPTYLIAPSGQVRTGKNRENVNQDDQQRWGDEARGLWPQWHYQIKARVVWPTLRQG